MRWRQFGALQECGLAAGPVRNPEDLIEDPHCTARDNFVAIEHPELGRTFLYPRQPRQQETTPWRWGPRAPLLLGRAHRRRSAGNWGSIRSPVLRRVCNRVERLPLELYIRSHQTGNPQTLFRHPERSEGSRAVPGAFRMRREKAHTRLMICGRCCMVAGLLHLRCCKPTYETKQSPKERKLETPTRET